VIESVGEDNLKDVLPLIRKYQEFYGVDNICDVDNEKFFSQFGENSSLGCQFVYRNNGDVLGFATVYFSFTSTIAKKVAVLNDLYSLPEARKQGIATKLIEHCREYASQSNAVRLQWVTAPDNNQAQLVYDKLPVNKSTWNFYSYNV